MQNIIHNNNLKMQLRLQDLQSSNILNKTINKKLLRSDNKIRGNFIVNEIKRQRPHPLDRTLS